MRKTFFAAIATAILLVQPLYAQQQAMTANPAPQSDNSVTLNKGRVTVIPGDRALRIQMDVENHESLWVEMTSEQAERLMLALAVNRSRMADQVANVAPAPREDRAFIDFGPSFAIEKEQDGTRLLAFRHPGYGWLWFGLPATQAATVANGLANPQ